MKLKTKLIPLASIATACAAITPISLTACSTAYKMTNIYGMTEPTFDQYAPGEYVTEEDATRAYIHFMEANPKYFIEDMKWGIYQNWMSFYENSNYAITLDGWYEKFNSKINSLNCAVTAPTFGTVKINTGENIEEYPTLSFKMKVDVDAEVESAFDSSRDITTTHRIKASGEAKYDNMLIFAYPATRNDKTHGTNYISPESMLVDTTKPGWFITISEDATQQFKYRHNFSGWNIDYSFDFNDIITKTNSKTGVSTTSYETANYDSFVDTYIELENLIDLKTYSYSDPTIIGGEGPNAAWKKWINQSSESVLANTVLLDCVTHYLNKCNSQCYMYVPEHLSTECISTTTNVNLDGALYYPASDFTYDQRDKYEITLEVYNDNNEWVGDPVSIEESYHSWDADIPTLTFKSGNVLQPNWTKWLINKGAADTPIPATLNLNGHAPTDILDQTLGFVLASSGYRLVFNIHPKSSSGQGDHGVYPDGHDFDIRMDDGTGTILIDWLEE